MNIAFFADHLGERGTEVSLFDYAYYNQICLNNKSIILYKTHKLNKEEIIKKFQDNFELIHTNDFSEVDPILIKYKISHIYFQREGRDEGRLSKVAINCVHAVFNYKPHADKYASISEWVNGNNGKYPVVPYMINLPNNNENLRRLLNIPENAIVFGGYGGKQQFNIRFVQELVFEIAKTNRNIYFLFANFARFCENLPNVIHLSTISDFNDKVKFINTCDAMLWARSEGETFGLSIGEFSTLNKPVIVMDIGDRAHVHLLKDKALWYNNKEDLRNILINFNPSIESKKDWNAYKDYTPEKVMKIFNNVFLS